MRAISEQSHKDATEIGGRFPTRGDRIVSPRKFGLVAKALWPFKTAAHLAAIAGREERTAARWLSGEFEPPAVVIAAVIAEMFRVE